MTYAPAALLGAILARVQASTPPVTLAQIADGHEPQLELMTLACELAADGGFLHRNIIAMCSRRAGKSNGIMGLLAMDAAAYDGVQIYFGKTKPAVRLSIWHKIWKPFCKKHGFKVDHNETSMVTTFPNGAVVAFTGTDDVAHVESYLGNKLRRAVLDECFPAGTLVSGMPIEFIAVGDSVTCVDHLTGNVEIRTVVRTFCKRINEGLVTVTTRHGSVSATADHPFFVRGRGYVRASDVAAGDLLCVRRSNQEVPWVHPEDVRDQMHGRDGAEGRGCQEDRGALRPARWTPDEPKAAVQQGMPIRQAADAVVGPDARTGSAGGNLGVDDPQESDAQPRGQGEDVGHAAADSPQATDSRREWQGSDQGGSSASCCPRPEVDHQPRGEYGAGETVRVSDLLQAGLGGSGHDDMYRGRWSEPLRPGAASTGPEEDGVLEWTRVESVSREEPRSPEGTTVYNIEVEGAHTYFANGVLVHNCQAQSPSVLDPLVNRILPPALSDTGGQLMLAGTIPEVPAGTFYDLWVKGEGWLKRNWSRFQNPHMVTPEQWKKDPGLTIVEHQMKRLDEFLRASGRKIDDPLVRRDWFGEFVFDVSATAYAYSRDRNQYKPVEPMGLAKFLEKFRADPSFAHIHRTITPDDGTCRHGIMAAIPFKGIEVYACAIDPGAARDRFSVEVVGWGTGTPKVQQVFEFSSARKANLSWGQIAPIITWVQAAYGPSWWFYDAGGSKVVLDSFVGDTGLPALQPASKSGLKGQVDRVSDMLLRGWIQVMQGSALEEDYQKARWDPDARAKHIWKYASQWHPDPAESFRYAMAAFLEVFEPEQEAKSPEDLDREKQQLAVRRRQAARMGNILDEDMDAAIAADEEEEYAWD